MGGARQPFAGDHVAIAGRLSLFSKRDVRSLVERLGGVFSADVTRARPSSFLPPHLSIRHQPHGACSLEDEFCVEADLIWETLKTRYYSARDLRAMYSALRDETSALSREMGTDRGGGRAVFVR